MFGASSGAPRAPVQSIPVERTIEMNSQRIMPSECVSKCRDFRELVRIFNNTKSARAVAGYVAILALILACASTANAQAAHYSGVVASWGSSSSPLASNLQGLAVDASGDVYYVDGSSNLYEMVAVNGTLPSSPTINTWSPATLGNNEPQGPLAIDALGDVFFAGGPGGSNGGSIFEIHAVGGAIPTSSPTVTTVISGLPNPADLPVPVQGLVLDTAGDLFLSDSSNNSILEVAAGNHALSSVATGFNDPQGLAIDSSGDVFVADSANKAIKEIEAVGGTIPSNPTIRSLGSGWGETTGVAVDPSGDVFVTDLPTGGVDVESRSGFTPEGFGVTLGVGTLVEMVAVNGSIPATPTLLQLGSGLNGNSPNVALARSAAGNLFVATASAISQVELPAVQFGPTNVASAGSTILVPFTFDSAGTPSGWNVLPNEKGANAALDFAEVPASDTCSTSQSFNAGSICSIAVQFTPQHPGLRTGVVQLLGAGGNVIATAHLAGIGQGPQILFPSNNTGLSLGSGLSGPFGIAVDSAGNLFVADTGNGLLKEIVAVNGVIPASPTIVDLAGVSGDIIGVAVDAAGDVYYTNGTNNSVHEILAVDGTIPGSPTINTLAAGLTGIGGLAVDSSGDVFVTDNAGIKEILAVNGVIPSSPKILTLGSNELNAPTGVALDAAGDIFVADTGDNAVKEIVAEGGAIPASPQILTLGSGFIAPAGVAVDAAGDVFVASREISGGVDPSGITELIAVDGAIPANPSTITYTTELAGDNSDVAVDSAGNIFATSSASSITEFALATPPALTFPTATTEGTTDTTDDPMSATVANDGNTPLIFPVPKTGKNPNVSSSFVWDSSSTCEQTTTASLTAFSLAEGANCTIAIDFAPVAGGSIHGTVAVTDNSENAAYATQSIALSGTSISDVTPTPTFSPLAGTYTSPQSVTILDSNSGAIIYYTTDGSNPTTSSAVFNSSNPIVVSDDTTIKAMAVASGLKNSSVAAGTFNIRLATPTFSPLAGTYYSPQQVSISDSATSAAIWYTTDGTTPVPGQGTAVQFTGTPIMVNVNTTIKAVAALTNFTTSSMASATYTLKVATPTFSPLMGTYYTTQSVTISDTTPNSVIWYTTDGTTPVPGEGNAVKFTGTPIAINLNTTVKAVAAVSGWTNSNAASAAYSLKVATPTVSPKAGTYLTAQSVTISDTASNSVIWYTTDGTTPVPGEGTAVQFTGTPIAVTKNTTIKAVAAVAGWTTSSPASAAYMLKVATPTFSPLMGTYYTTQSVTISDTASNSVIWYTTDGTTPVPGEGTSVPFTGTPIAIGKTTTVKAVAAVSGWTTSSAGSATYTLKVTTPTIGTASGTYYSTQSVTLADSNSSATIYYTVDGSTPITGTGTTLTYTPGTPVQITKTTTLRVVAAVTGWATSSMATATYTLKVTTPTISVASGTYYATQSVTLSDTNSSATIYYTIDGSTPITGTGTTLTYTGTPVQITQTTTLKVVAAITGWSTSNMATATYTLKVATPTFSPVAGVYTSAQSVSINDATSGVVIWYTTNGSTPTAGGAGSTQYTGTAIPVNSTTTIKAIGVISGWTTSTLATGTYTIR